MAGRELNREKKSGLMKEISPLNLICNFGGEKVKGGDDVFHAGIAMSIMLYWTVSTARKLTQKYVLLYKYYGRLSNMLQ